MPNHLRDIKIQMHACGTTVASLSLSARAAARAKPSKVSARHITARSPAQSARTRLGVVPRSTPKEEEIEMDPDANIEPCLVGWSDKDENGVDVYCCEQPGGGVVCKTVNPVDQQECEVVEDEKGDLTVACDDDEVP